MIDGKKILAVIPARGGSKGIPLKNLRCIGGKPLVAMAGEVANAISEIDRRVVSTDHPEIARVAKIAGLDCPFMRPKEISGDRVSDWEVLVDVLDKVERIDGVKYDVVVMLQPTSPLRKPSHVIGALKMFIGGAYDAVWSVSQSDSKAHPYKQLIIEGEELEYWDNRGKDVIARQQLDATYHRNGVVYVVGRDCLLSQKSIKGQRTGAFVIEGHQISIDTEFDIFLTEQFIAYSY